MSVGVIVVAGVVGAFALCETVLPWTFAALRKWRKAQAEKKNADGFAVRKVGEMACGYDGPSGLRHNAISPELSSSANDAALAFSDSGAARAEKEEQIPSAGVGIGLENAKSTHRASDRRSKEERDEEARRLWEEARAMKHRFKPDWEKDRDYLAKVYGAARLGHLEAMTKLGEYAYRRRAIVEAYYWTALAEMKGAKGLGEPLRKMRMQWMSKGCPPQHSNAYDGFSEQQGSFARAVLRLKCGVDPQYARARLKELAERGVEEARLFLKA